MHVIIWSHFANCCFFIILKNSCYSKRFITSCKPLSYHHNLRQDMSDREMTWTNRQGWVQLVPLITNHKTIHGACIQPWTCKWMTPAGSAQELWQHSTVTFRCRSDAHWNCSSQLALTDTHGSQTVSVLFCSVGCTAVSRENNLSISAFFKKITREEQGRRVCWIIAQCIAHFQRKVYLRKSKGNITIWFVVLLGL